MASDDKMPSFATNTINLASGGLGASAVAVTDDFFAPVERMLSDRPPIFLPDKFDDHGKWMDGWETRRRRNGGHDHAIVKLGLPGTISEILSVPLITEARKRYPRIQLRIAEAMSGFVLEWMRESRIDLAVIYREVADAGLATVELLEEELVFFAPARGLGDEVVLPRPGRSLGLAEVARMPLILPGQDHGLRSLLDQHAKSARVALNVSIEVDSYSNIKELVAAGFGCSVLPLNAVSREVQAGSLSSWTIAEPPIRRSVHLASSVERPMTNAVAAIRDLVRDLLRELARNGNWIGATELPERPGEG